MLLKYLTIEKGQETIRRITFKAGVNLIVDTTASDNESDSGNNVGKTTVLRLVDYCLGGDAIKIYQDQEFRKTNSTVKNFLEDNDVLVTLCLGKSLDDSANDIVIKRNFLKRSEKVATINDVPLTSDESFCQKLNQLIFGVSENKPTFRQLLPRYIRSDASRMDKVIKYLHPTTTNNVYEGIYLFLFTGSAQAAGLSSEKEILSKKLGFYNKVASDTFSSRTASAITQHLALIVSDINKLEEQKRQFNINPQYEREFSELRRIKDDINRRSTDLSKVQFRLNLLKESTEELKQHVSNVNTDSLKSLYQEAKLYIPNLQKSFDDSVKFYNQLIINKLTYLSEDIPQLEKEIDEKKQALNNLLAEEANLGKKLVATGSLADYELIVSALNKKFEQKGRLEEELGKLQELESGIDRCSKRIEEINTQIRQTESLLNQEITKFNESFSAYSEKFYAEKFAFSATFDHANGVYKFDISNVDGQLGDGKKKGLIAAFDLAYISYTNNKGVPAPQFAMHDRIEGIHGNQLKSLIDIVNSADFNGQYIASVLSGKFSELQLSDSYLEENKILELSQNDKLFRIERQNH